MKIGVLGTGMVGQSLGSKLAQLGHQVKMGSRTAPHEKAVAWVKATGANASAGTFREAAVFGEMLFNCTKGVASLAALEAAGSEHLQGKTLVDVANPLDFSHGMPPSLFISNTDSLGEQIQQAFPGAHVVKALNTMSCALMVNPSLVPGKHDVFLCGNDAHAKSQVIKILTEGFGWASPIDLGDITNARATEMLLPIWIRLWGHFQHANFNFHVATGPTPAASPTP